MGTQRTKGGTRKHHVDLVASVQTLLQTSSPYTYIQQLIKERSMRNDVVICVVIVLCLPLWNCTEPYAEFKEIQQREEATKRQETGISGPKMCYHRGYECNQPRPQEGDPENPYRCWSVDKVCYSIPLFCDCACAAKLVERELIELGTSHEPSCICTLQDNGNYEMSCVTHG